MNDFLHMGGHAFYVWTAYGAAVVLIVMDFLPTMRRMKSLRAAIARRRKKRAQPPGPA